MENPFFSIVVVSFNAEQSIAKTINSVLEQSFENYEIVVKDGASKDNTLENIPKSEKIRVYSTKDGGIYDAMNEAVGYANGEYICFLNCGDFFAHTSVLSDISAAIQKSQCSVVYGDYKRKGVIQKQPNTLSDFDLYRSPLCHQTMFIKKQLFQIHGNYDTSFKICADWCHTVKTFKAKETYFHCDTVVCDYEGGGASETQKGLEIKREETKRIRESHFSPDERVRFDKKISHSFFKLRQKMASDKAPKWVRKFYRWCVGKYNSK